MSGRPTFVLFDLHALQLLVLVRVACIVPCVPLSNVVCLVDELFSAATQHVCMHLTFDVLFRSIERSCMPSIERC